MKRIGYSLLLVLTLASCQKEQPITPTPRANTKLPVVTTYGYFIPSNAKKDTTIWISNILKETYKNCYINGVLWREELYNSEIWGIDTLYVVKVEAYTGADSHREDIINIKSTRGLDLQMVKVSNNIIHFDTAQQVLVMKHILNPTYTDYYTYKK
jgi:hypothetical protein